MSVHLYYVLVVQKQVDRIMRRILCSAFKATIAILQQSLR